MSAESDVIRSKFLVTYSTSICNISIRPKQHVGKLPGYNIFTWQLPNNHYALLYVAAPERLIAALKKKNTVSIAVPSQTTSSRVPDGHPNPWCIYQYSWTFICLSRFLLGQSFCNLIKLKVSRKS